MAWVVAALLGLAGLRFMAMPPNSADTANVARRVLSRVESRRGGGGGRGRPVGSDGAKVGVAEDVASGAREKGSRKKVAAATKREKVAKTELDCDDGSVETKTNKAKATAKKEIGEKKKKKKKKKSGKKSNKEGTTKKAKAKAKRRLKAAASAVTVATAKAK